MPREFIDPHSGLVLYRTKLLPRDLADSFARCLLQNHRFCDVQTVTSEKARTDRAFYVTYRPSNRDRVLDQAERQQQKRTAKAETEGRAYEWFLDTDHPGRPFYYCLSTSGEVYEVTACSCTCPDHEYRCARSNFGLQCKHCIAYEQAVERGALVSLADVIAGRHHERIPAAA